MCVCVGICVQRSYSVICSIQLSRRPSGTNELSFLSRKCHQKNRGTLANAENGALLMVYVGASMSKAIISNVPEFDGKDALFDLIVITFSAFTESVRGNGTRLNASQMFVTFPFVGKSWREHSLTSFHQLDHMTLTLSSKRVRTVVFSV